MSPLDIADAITEEKELSFEGRTIRYIASDEVSPNELVEILGKAIGNPNLKWVQISDEEMLEGMLSMGVNTKIAQGIVEMQASQRSGLLFDYFYRNKPILGKVKLTDFAKDFELACNIQFFEMVYIWICCLFFLFSQFIPFIALYHSIVFFIPV